MGGLVQDDPGHLEKRCAIWSLPDLPPARSTPPVCLPVCLYAACPVAARREVRRAKARPSRRATATTWEEGCGSIRAAAGCSLEATRAAAPTSPAMRHTGHHRFPGADSAEGTTGLGSGSSSQIGGGGARVPTSVHDTHNFDGSSAPPMHAAWDAREG